MGDFGTKNEVGLLPASVSTEEVTRGVDLNCKRVTVEQALRRIRHGSRIFVGSGCAEPLTLTQGLVDYSGFFADNIIIHLLTLGEAPYARPEFADAFRHNAFFIGPNVRQAVAEGRADYTPVFLSEIPNLFSSGQMPLDTALIAVSPPDAEGYCSLGPSVDIVMAAAMHARYVVAEVNHKMPRTFGDSFIHLRDIDAIIETDRPLPELPAARTDAVSDRIGYYVSRLIKDGATLQLGIGAVPNAVLAQLKDKNDLGVHTEMFSDGIIDLVERGNITGARKTLHQNAIVTSFCMGSRRLFEWVDENPHVLFYPSDYVNDPEVIARNAKMVAVNSALAVDLTGQVCADRIGCRFYSGIGGQVEFIRGASHAAGGRAIIALPSTAKGGKVSRITATLEEGAGVVTSRGDVQYVVTEFGIAYLHGKSIRERALALIDIAHPDFRDELLEQARCRFHCGIEMHHGSHLALYPAEYEQTKAFYNGSGEINLTFRAIRPSDERRLQDFFYSHSDETIHLRYGMMLRALPHQKAMELVQLDYQKQLAIIGLAGEAENEKIVAIGRYFLDEQTRLAEVAFVVHEDYRRLGIASHLLSCLKEIAQKKGFRGITAQELAENGPMLDVFKEVMGPPSTAQSRDGETELTYLFPEQNDSKPGTMMPSKKETA